MPANKTLNRRRFLRGAAVAGLAASSVSSGLVAAGGGSTHGPARVTRAQAAATGSEPRPDGTPAPADQQVLRMVTPSPFYMDPITYAGDMWQLQMVVYQALTRFEPDGRLVGGVADSWEGSADGSIWTFVLNPNAKFSDGSPITANDVKWTYEWMANPNSKCWNPGEGAGRIVGYDNVANGESETLDGIVVPDERTIVFNLTAPFGGFPANAAFFSAAVLKRDNVMTGEEWWRSPVTSGFFKVTEFTPGDQARMTLEPNEHWWRDKPTLQRVTVELVANVQTQLVLYDNDQVDGMLAQPADYAEALRPDGQRHADLFWELATGSWLFGYRCGKKPFDEVKVRQAFASAIDMNGVAAAALNGIYQPATRILPDQFPCGGAQVWQPTFDPERAKQLIAESTYGSVDNLPKATLFVSEAGGATGVSTWGRVALAIQQQLQDNLGAEVEVVRQPFSSFDELAQAMDASDGGAVWRSSLGPTYYDPSYMTALATTDGPQNRFQYGNPRVDELLAQADSATDPTTRCQLYDEADKIFSEEAVFLAPFRDTSAWFFKPKVRGMQIENGRFWPSLHQMYIAES